MTIMVFTQSYPYDFAAEHIFIRPELHHLAESFEKVVFVPRVCKGAKLSLPSDVEVDERYAKFLQENSFLGRELQLALDVKPLFQEIRDRPSLLLYPSKILKLILYSIKAELTAQWIRSLIKNQQINPKDCILYSYWFDHAVTGFSMVKQEFPDIKIVSRAHGYDFYEEYYYPYYWPHRRKTLKALDALFFASDAGKNYFCDRYPEFSAKYRTAHLGIKDPGFLSSSSSDGVFRIVSCSYIVAVKRLGLLLDGIAVAARLRPGQKFEWVHFGDGKSRKSLEGKVQRNFPSNAKGCLLGNMPNEEIYRYYKDNPIDVFVNVSETEGGAPVSIQEAISCGIPVIATSVGGNVDIVSEKNGLLLEPNPTSEKIGKVLLSFWDDSAKAIKKRQGSRAVWQQHFNADNNFRAFAKELIAIRET